MDQHSFLHSRINWTLGAECDFNEAFTGCLPELRVSLNAACSVVAYDEDSYCPYSLSVVQSCSVDMLELERLVCTELHCLILLF